MSLLVIRVTGFVKRIATNGWLKKLFPHTRSLRSLETQRAQRNIFFMDFPEREKSIKQSALRATYMNIC